MNKLESKENPLGRMLSTAFRDYGDVPFAADPAMINNRDSHNM